jgi:hypothetical protein
VLTEQAFAIFHFAMQGNQESHLRITALKITTRGKSSEWSALEKPVAPPPTNAEFPNPPNSLAESARDFASGLPASLPLSFTPAKRLNLELAKGFEPLTL